MPVDVDECVSYGVDPAPSAVRHIGTYDDVTSIDFKDLKTGDTITITSGLDLDSKPETYIWDGIQFIELESEDNGDNETDMTRTAINSVDFVNMATADPIDWSRYAVVGVDYLQNVREVVDGHAANNIYWAPRWVDYASGIVSYEPAVASSQFRATIHMPVVNADDYQEADKSALDEFMANLGEKREEG